MVGRYVQKSYILEKTSYNTTFEHVRYSEHVK